MSPGFYLRSLVRESRGSRGRLAFFIACLAVGVAAVVAVAGLSASLRDGIRREARQLLAADLAVRGNQPLPPAVLAAVTDLPGARRTDVKETVTVAAAPPRNGQPGPSQLVELKVIEGFYPFYGKLELRPRKPLNELLTPETTVVASDLLAHLGLKVGDTLQIGGQGYRIAGVVLSEPDRVSISFTLGPRVFLSGRGFARTTLEDQGSRMSYKALVKLPEGAPAAALDAVADRLRQALPPGEVYRVETYRQSQPALQRNISRVERFLGLVALLSLFVGGIGVAQSVRAWLSGRLDAIAILKCLGMRPREIFPLYLGQTLLLGLAGSLVGILAGIAVQLVLPHLFPDLIPGALIRPWQPAALLRGLGLGVGVALLFSLPPLSAVLRVPPARVLRREAEPLPRHRWVSVATLLALAVGIWGMAAFQSGSARLGAQFTGGVALVTAALAAAAFLVSWGVRRLPRDLFSLRPWLRHGIAALARPGAAASGAIVALGLGVLVVLGMSLVEGRITGQLEKELPTNAPSAFLIDIQPAQWPGVEALLAQQGAKGVESVPVVMARLTAVDGVPVEKLQAQEGGQRQGGEEGGRRRERWALTREQRLTYMKELPKDNKIVAGSLWNDPAHPEVSLEAEFANDLGAHLGSTLSFNIQGVPVDLRVTSLRTVNWQTFGINFFLVVEPGVLEGAPQQRLAVARLPRGSEQRMQDLLAARFPNVTFLRIREILEKVLKVLRRISLGIRFLGGFTVVAGIAILAGAVSAGSARRGREVALLKTLGMTRRGVAATFAVEYALVGLVAGLIGAAGGTALAWGVVTRGFEIPWTFAPLNLAMALAGTVLLAVVAGLAASLRALERRPIEVLRTE
ncbi:MAG TPA: FtsX-like permease family protein [Thermoanaerobaculia bacterium]|nr:FtsX-like permease family protein [Thermoanaerobaculia bacterium]